MESFLSGRRRQLREKRDKLLGESSRQRVTSGNQKGRDFVKENTRAYELPGDSEQIVRAAWLYHVAGNTQEQTADLLGISRVKVNRLLAEAREFGIVKISIEHRFARMVEVEENIRRRYNLSLPNHAP
jgi:hypothetical protein